MPAKLLLHLRYLRPSFPVARFSTMKPVKTTRAIPIFSRIFPHKLKYKSFGSLSLTSNNSTSRQHELKTQFSNNAVRNLSSSLGRARTESSSGREVRASRSLIEDEADLSDWVGGLSSDSFKKTRLYSDSDKNDDDESESDIFGKGRGRGREERGGKRRRENGFDDFSRGGRQEGARYSVDKFPRRGNEGGNVSSRQKGRELNDRYSGGSPRGKGRFGGELEGMRQKRRGDKDSGSRLEMNRDGGRGIRRGEKGERRRGILVSEDDDVDEGKDGDEDGKGYRGFKDLIGSDEDSEEVDNDDDEEEEDEEEGRDVFSTESVLSRHTSEDGGKGSPLGSPGSSDSYLSETR